MIFLYILAIVGLGFGAELYEYGLSRPSYQEGPDATAGSIARTMSVLLNSATRAITNANKTSLAALTGDHLITPAFIQSNTLIDTIPAGYLLQALPENLHLFVSPIQAESGSFSSDKISAYAQYGVIIYLNTPDIPTRTSDMRIGAALVDQTSNLGMAGIYHNGYITSPTSLYTREVSRMACAPITDTYSVDSYAETPDTYQNQTYGETSSDEVTGKQSDTFYQEQNTGGKNMPQIYPNQNFNIYCANVGYQPLTVGIGISSQQVSSYTDAKGNTTTADGSFINPTATTSLAGSLANTPNIAEGSLIIMNYVKPSQIEISYVNGADSPCVAWKDSPDTCLN